MENFKAALLKVAQNNELSTSGNSIEQKQRNAIKRSLTEALRDILRETIGDNLELALYQTKDGLMIGIDNAKVGIIPVEVKIVVKNLDVDPADEEDAYLEHLEEQAEKKRRMEATKLAKMERQARERELRKQLRNIKNDEGE